MPASQYLYDPCINGANAAVPGANAVNVNYYRPYPGYTSITTGVSIGTANYHALQTGFVYRLADLQLNAGYTWSGASSYLNSGNSFFSMVHFSAGYTFKWDHIGDVRLEPYWNIPMTGVGIGRMSIMSTGLYLGITHPFR